MSSEHNRQQLAYNRDPQADIYYYAVGTELFRVIGSVDEGTAFKDLLKFLDTPEVIPKAGDTKISRRSWLLHGQLELDPALAPVEDKQRNTDKRQVLALPTIAYIGGFVAHRLTEFKESSLVNAKTINNNSQLVLFEENRDTAGKVQYIIHTDSSAA